MGRSSNPAVSFARVCDNGTRDLGCQGDVDIEAARRTGEPGITTARPSTDSDALTGVWRDFPCGGDARACDLGELWIKS